MASPALPPSAPPPGRPPRLGSAVARTQLGLAAFAPALALMAVRVREVPWLALACAAVAAIGLAGGLDVVLGLRRTGVEPYAFGDVEASGAELVGHIGSFVLPVVVDPAGDRTEVGVAAVALALVVHVHIATGNVLVSPLLALAGLRTYRATTDTGVTYLVVARSDPADWHGTVLCRPVGSGVLVEAGRAAVRARAPSRPRRSAGWRPQRRGAGP